MVEQIDRKRATEEEINKGLELLAKKRDYDKRVKSGELKGPKKWADLTEAEKDAARLQGKKAAIKTRLIKEKATKAGITVTAAEVEAELRAGKAK